MNKEISDLIGVIFEINKQELDKVDEFVSDIIKYNFKGNYINNKLLGIKK